MRFQLIALLAFPFLASAATLGKRDEFDWLEECKDEDNPKGTSDSMLMINLPLLTVMLIMLRCHRRRHMWLETRLHFQPTRRRLPVLQRRAGEEVSFPDGVSWKERRSDWRMIEGW